MALMFQPNAAGSKTLASEQLAIGKKRVTRKALLW